MAATTMAPALVGEPAGSSQKIIQMGTKAAPTLPFTSLTRNVDVFEKLEQIGEGTYGQVYKARSRDDGSIVALKKIRTKDQEKDGFPITALREIKILKVLRHPNVVHLREIVTSAASDANKGKGSIYMVFEFMDHDLTGLMDGWPAFSIPQVKCYMQQLLEGLHYCHMNKVLHRDIKGANLLINNKGELKLADFGLARPFDDQARAYTNRCVTLWYRPPELLLGATLYGPEVDMWSVGCVLCEMLLRKAALPGKDEADQLDHICRLCGTPDESNWPGVSKLPMFDRFLGASAKPPLSPGAPRPLVQKLGKSVTDPAALDLLDKLLTLNPSARITCAQARDHDYFRVAPLPAQPLDLPQYDKNCFEFNRRKKQQPQPAGHGQQQPPAGSAQTGSGAEQQPASKRARVDLASQSVTAYRASGGRASLSTGATQKPSYSSAVPPPRQPQRPLG